MLRVDITIKGEIWSIHINEDSSKLGTNYLDCEIWVNGERELIERNLRRFLMIAVDCEYVDEQEPSNDEIEIIVMKIMNAYGMKL